MSVFLLPGIRLPYYTLFFIRTSKFCLRLAVLIFFFHFWGWNVLNLFLFPRLNLVIPQRRMSDWVQEKQTISFILFPSSSAHRQPLGDVLQKIGSPTVLKAIKKIPAKEFNFLLKLQASSLQIELPHRYFSWILNTDVAVFCVD